MAAFEATAESHVGLVTDRGELQRLASGPGPLSPSECMRRAERAAMALHLAALDRTSAGDAVLLWRSDASEAWLNLWWQPRDTGFHDHDGSCVGVYVIEGTARNEALMIGEPRRVDEYGPGDRFAFPGNGIHRMEHEAGAVTIHVYSPPIRSIGEYELEDGELRRRPVAPDEPSAASPRLLAAVKATGTSRHNASRTLP
jgi:quercetin dioxygenase-like cupin family protein